MMNGACPRSLRNWERKTRRIIICVALYNYRNVFNPETGFFHPKDKDGKFIYPLDYRYDGGLGARDY